MAWTTGAIGGDDGTEIRALGEPVENPSRALADTEEELRSVLDQAGEQGPAPAHDGVSCWYSYPDGQDEPNDFVRCGPVVFADSAEGTHWLEVPVRFRPGDGGTEVTIADVRTTHRRTWALADGEALVRPDGRDAPAGDDIDLERPPAVTAEPGLVERVPPGALMFDLEPPGDGHLIGVGHRTEILGAGRTDRVLLVDRQVDGLDVFQPADGEEWLVFEVASEVAPGAAGDPALAVAVDGEHRPLEVGPLDLGPLDDRLIDDGGGDPAPEQEQDRSGVVFAAAVPADAEDVSLVVAEGQLEQSWSFTTGERSDDAPQVLYRDPDTLTAAVDASGSLPYGATDLLAVPGFGDVPGLDESIAFGQAELTFSVDRAHLAYQVETWRGSSVEPLSADGPDRALLYLTGVTTGWADVLHQHPVSPDDVVLVLADGTELGPLDLGGSELDPVMLADGGFDPGLGLSFPLVWDVPADVESATVRLAPGNHTNELFTIDYQGGSVALPLSFG